MQNFSPRTFTASHPNGKRLDWQEALYNQAVTHLPIHHDAVSLNRFGTYVVRRTEDVSESSGVTLHLRIATERHVSKDAASTEHLLAWPALVLRDGASRLLSMKARDRHREEAQQRSDPAHADGLLRAAFGPLAMTVLDPLPPQRSRDLIQNRRVINRRRHGPFVVVGDLLHRAAQDFS